MLKRIYVYIKHINPLYRFLINIIILVFLWTIFYKLVKPTPFFDYVYEEGVYYFSRLLLETSAFFLKLVGYNVEIYGKIISVNGANGILLDKGCVGRNLLGVFVGFLLAYPGAAKKKIWFIPLGFIVVNFVNVIRIIFLALTDYCCKQYLDINHHLIFKYTVYFVVFMIWYVWVKKVADPSI